jgi:tricarboxylate carrier
VNLFGVSEDMVLNFLVSDATCQNSQLILNLKTCDTAIPEKMTDRIPPFDPNGTRYDSSTYGGRLRNILSAINPSTLLLSDSQVKSAQDLLLSYKQNNNSLPPNTTDAQLWTAQQQVAAVIHPATGEPISPTIGRMSAFLFPNVLNAAGMLMHGPTSTAAGIFWQWMNQTYNSVNNYANRSSAEVDMRVLGASYGLAVGAACSIALGAGVLMKRVPSMAKVGLLVPYLATVTAGGTNVAFTRITEITDGIPVYDKDGDEVGVSITAGRTAVMSTVLTRSAFLPIFPLLIPPAIMQVVKKTNLVRAGGPLIAFEVMTITACLGIGLPLALALQPQKMTLDVNNLEQIFQGLDPKTGKPREVVYANKGL